MASLGPEETVSTTVEPRVSEVPAEGSEWITRPSATLVGVDAVDLDLEVGVFERGRRLRQRLPGGRGHLAFTGAFAVGEGHFRLRAEDGQERAAFLDIPGNRVLLGHRAGGRVVVHVLRRRP